MEKAIAFLKNQGNRKIGIAGASTTGMLPIASGLLVSFAFKAGRKYSRECKQTRIDIDSKLSKIVMEW